jgi:hypothetical protein
MGHQLKVGSFLVSPWEKTAVNSKMIPVCEPELGQDEVTKRLIIV